MKRLFIYIIIAITLTPLAQASWAMKLANGLKNTATWGFPALSIGGLHYLHYPEHYAALLKNIGTIHSSKTVDELFCNYKFYEFVGHITKNPKTKPIYFLDKSLAEREKRTVNLTRLGWVLTSDSLNDLATKNPQAITSEEKAARLFMSIKYNV